MGKFLNKNRWRCRIFFSPNFSFSHHCSPTHCKFFVSSSLVHVRDRESASIGERFKTGERDSESKVKTSMERGRRLSKSKKFSELIQNRSIEKKEGGGNERGWKDLKNHYLARRILDVISLAKNRYKNRILMVYKQVQSNPVAWRFLTRLC
jgi:hypothetical protein